jgi:hypothetical protein
MTLFHPYDVQKCVRSFGGYVNSRLPSRPEKEEEESFKVASFVKCF